MSHLFDSQYDEMISVRESVTRWIKIELLALRMAELLTPLSSDERRQVIAEVEILLTHSGRS